MFLDLPRLIFSAAVSRGASDGLGVEVTSREGTDLCRVLGLLIRDTDVLNTLSP